MFQAREAMRRRAAGDGRSLLDAVDSYVEAHRLSHPTLALAWEYATSVEREGALVQSLAAALGLDETALHELFRLAAGIRA